MSSVLLPSPRTWHVEKLGVPELETPASAALTLQGWLEAAVPAARFEAAGLLRSMFANGWSACTDGPCSGAEKRLRITAGSKTWLVHLRPQLPHAVRHVERVIGPQADNDVS